MTYEPFKQSFLPIGEPIAKEFDVEGYLKNKGFYRTESWPEHRWATKESQGWTVVTYAPPFSPTSMFHTGFASIEQTIREHGTTYRKPIKSYNNPSEFMKDIERLIHSQQ